MKRFHRIAVQSLMVAGLTWAGPAMFAQSASSQQNPQSQSQPTQSIQDQATQAQERPATQDQTAPTQDNSTMNRPEQSKNAPSGDRTTPKTDREVSQQIHQALMQDSTLADSARNVKIAAQNGTVTLKGTVHSQEEKQAIGAKATEVSNGAKVVNNLTVTLSQK